MTRTLRRIVYGGRRAQTTGLLLLAAGAVAAGAGHGLAVVDAQQELNDIAPAERRGEVTAAFIASIYALVGGSVIGTGLLDRLLSLQASVGAVAGVLVLLALSAAVWHAPTPTRLRVTLAR